MISVAAAEPERVTDPRAWSYDEAFCRNVGLIGQAEQEVLRNSRVAIAGMGGVGGVHLITLARLGVGRFTIADPDIFDSANTNRQFGATQETMGRSKATVMAEVARSINPELDIRVYTDPIGQDNVGEFLHDADLFVDGVDFFSIEPRRILFRHAAECGLFSVTAGPIGFSTAWLVFDPAGMSFDHYFDISDDMDHIDKLIAFAVGLAPRATQFSYMDLKNVSLQSRTGPSTSLACQLAAGVMGAETVKILLGRPNIRSAPRYQQFDPYVGRLAKGRLIGGNRHPLQRLKRWWLARKFHQEAAP